MTLKHVHTERLDEALYEQQCDFVNSSTGKSLVLPRKDGQS